MHSECAYEAGGMTSKTAVGIIQYQSASQTLAAVVTQHWPVYKQTLNCLAVHSSLPC